VATLVPELFAQWKKSNWLKCAGLKWEENNVHTLYCKQEISFNDVKRKLKRLTVGKQIEENVGMEGTSNNCITFICVILRWCIYIHFDFYTSVIHTTPVRCETGQG
jgi:hypothetical protein